MWIFYKLHNPLWPCPSHVCACVKGSVIMQCVVTATIVCVCVCAPAVSDQVEKGTNIYSIQESRVIVVETQHLWTDLLNSLVE